jgi:hypothetical protein
VRSLIEIDFVAGFESETDRAERYFGSGGWIESGVKVSSAESENRAGDVTIGQQTGASGGNPRSLFSKWRMDASDLSRIPTSVRKGRG